MDFEWASTSIFQNSRIRPRLLNVPVVSPSPNKPSPSVNFRSSRASDRENPVLPAGALNNLWPPELLKCHEPRSRSMRHCATGVLRATKRGPILILARTGGQFVFDTAHDGR